ncbi:MAG: LTA synthase family protein [Bacteroides sp.]
MCSRHKYTIESTFIVALVYRLLVAYLFFGITRLLFYLFNYTYFSELTLAQVSRAWYGGIRFDTAAVLYLNLLFVVLSTLPLRLRKNKYYQRIIDWSFYIPNTLGIMAGLADCAYFPYTLRRTTATVFSEFAHERSNLFLHLIIEYWYITLLALVLTILLVFLYRRVRPTHFLAERQAWFLYYPLQLFFTTLSLVYAVWGLRGGSFSKNWRPLGMSYANVSVDKIEHRALVLNTPYCIIRTLGKQELPTKHFFATEQEAERFFHPQRTLATDTTARFGALKGRNLVIIIIESFARQYVGCLNQHIPNYKGYTPCFDSLAAQGYLFQEMFANGRKSIDAMPSLLASIPPLHGHFVTSHYSGNRIHGLASYLQEMGYTSIFFHGAPNGSMGFDAFVKQAGYQHYFGATEYNNDTDYDGTWGIWDEPFLLRMVKELRKIPEPFLGTVFTLSSHEPFKVPQEYEGVFPDEGEPLVHCIGYTDHALGKFFQAAAREPWFENTLFLITADHANGRLRSEYRTSILSFATPMLLYAPGSTLIGFDDSTTVQQADLLPTVLSLLGYQGEIVTFGNNMFSTLDSHFAVCDFDGVFQFISSGFVLQHNGEKPTALFHYKQDNYLEHNLLDSLPTTTALLQHKFEALLQTYNQRMRENRLQCPTHIKKRIAP